MTTPTAASAPEHIHQLQQESAFERWLMIEAKAKYDEAVFKGRKYQRARRMIQNMNPPWLRSMPK